MKTLFESDVEQLTVELFEQQGYFYLTPEEQENERGDLSEVILKSRLRDNLERLNPYIPHETIDFVCKQIINIPAFNQIADNETFHNLLTEGVPVEFMYDGETVYKTVKIIDFENIYDNEFVVCNQFTVTENNYTKRPDIVLFVNGIPLVVIELKNPADENAKIDKAFTQLQNYKNSITGLFSYNCIMVISDGLDAKAGTISSEYSRFISWKTSDGTKEDKLTIPQIITLIKGMLNKTTLLDLVNRFIVFETTKSTDTQTGIITVTSIKKIASYHQYYAVNRAVESTIRAAYLSNTTKYVANEAPELYGVASVTTQIKGDKKAGVVWHTQGSGKSLTMVFYTGKIVLALDNPTIVVLTDRNDLDGQLFDTFTGCKKLLRNIPVQAEDRNHLKLLLKVAAGGIVFTTIQKFFPANGNGIYDLLSNRKNIVVIADEAHRSQYGFAAKNVYNKNGVSTTYGFAKYLRDALPNASFIGFTGTPIESTDISTPAVFGNYIDIYDIEKSVLDGATVRIYYESRLAKIHLKEAERKTIDEEVEAIAEDDENSILEDAKSKWAQLEAVVGHKERIKEVAADIVSHFEKRQEVFEGKGMIVCMSRRIAVELYDEIIKIHPAWHNTDKNKGMIKVVMTTSSSDPESWQPHQTTKQDRRDLGTRFKDNSDPLKLVIVRDMWLTGFDVPCLHTMYVDKPMRGHSLMQAIARVNRVYKDKPGGLIVDYIGIAADLKKALVTYTVSGGMGHPVLDQEKAVRIMLEKYEIVTQIFADFNYKAFLTANTGRKLEIILEAQEYILGINEGKERFIKQVVLLSKVFALSVPNEKAMKIKEEVGFFQAVKARLVKYEPNEKGKSNIEIETAIRQIVDKAIAGDGIIDVFDAAGIKKPDISILSDEFLQEVKNMQRKNIALELLKKILNDEIKLRSKKNLIQSRKFSEMLENSIRKYQNNLLTAVQIIDELINLAKNIKEEESKYKKYNLSEEEFAFYGALAENKSAKEVLGDEQLRVITVEVYKSVKGNATIDWKLKESVRARLRRDVKRVLKKYGYPPDMQLAATENILKQAEQLADIWAGEED
ncbi:MAG: type I restriction endonuclease subunit R [bacterium]